MEDAGAGSSPGRLSPARSSILHPLFPLLVFSVSSVALWFKLGWRARAAAAPGVRFLPRAAAAPEGLLLRARRHQQRQDNRLDRPAKPAQRLPPVAQPGRT